MLKVFFTGALLLVSLLAAGLASADCEFDIEVGDGMVYEISEMTIEKTCKEVTINLNHSGSLPAAAMGHNWVMSTADDLQPVALDGQNAGLDNAYVKSEDDRVIAHTDVVGGGEKTSIAFSTADLEAGGDYMFFCSAPGHWAVMQGKVIVKA